MHKPILRTRLRVPSYALAASLCAGAVSAQGTGAPPATGAVAPAQVAPTAPATGTQPPAAVPPAATPMASPGPTDVPPPAAGPGVPPAAAQPPPDALPPPRYGRLGGQPEPPIEKGSWDPWAQPVPGRFAHEGFFLRLNLGPSWSSVSRPDYKWSGFGLGMGLAVGGSLVENFSLHADFQNTVLPNPTQRAFGAKSDFNADIVFESMGIGATYYFMPVNIYVSGSVGLGLLVFEDDGGQSKDTSGGLALNGMVGKEWWVGSDWGLGLAAQLLFIRVKDYVDDRHMNALAINLLFSATYN
jgi:hypothetical protein